jgi:hypothetical protein
MRGRVFLLPFLALAQDACSCAGEPPRDPQVALVIDGIEVRRSEWDEFLPLFKSIEPERGEQTTRQRLLEHVLRMKLARRSHGAALDQAYRKAEELARICREQGAPALELYGGKTETEPGSPWRYPPALARAAFTLAEGQVSEAILLPEGATVIGVLARVPGPSALLDRVQLVTVDFPVSPQENLRQRLDAGVRALKGKISFVAKDLADAVPVYLRSDTP